jgi:hypothetical protein
MNKRILYLSILIVSLFCSLGIWQMPSTSAQVMTEQRRTPPLPPRSQRTPNPAQPPAVPDSGDEQDSEPLKASMKLDRGGKVTISNRFGVITVKGYDGDTVEASALTESGRGQATKIALIRGDAMRMRIALDGVPGRRPGRGNDFQIKVPRYAAVEILDSHESEVEVGDVEGAITVANGSGDVNIHQVGSLNLANWHRGDVVVRDVKGRCSLSVFSGDVTVDNVEGLIDVNSLSGEVTINNAGENVRANATSGEVILHCAKGRVDARSVSGSIELVGVKGDVDSETVSGEISFKGAIREGGSYRLKSLSGEVAMAIQSDAPGFTVTMTTFNGEIETAFPIKVESAVQQNETNRRIVGRFGNGQTRISLDSFNAGVRITKALAADLKGCK